MTHEEILKLAKDKGYDSPICFIAKYGGTSALPHDVIDKAGELCELTLIQEWLRVGYGVWMWVIPLYGKQSCQIAIETKDRLKFIDGFKTPEEAYNAGFDYVLNKLI